MSSFVKKLMAAGAALSIGISSFAVANFYNGPFTNNCCPPPVPVCDPCGPRWCDNISFEAAWLYWKASGNDFQFAVEKTKFVSGTSDGVSLFTSKEKFHDIRFKWDSGFRIGGGIDLPCQGWGVFVDWTHFDTSSNKKRHVEGDTNPPLIVLAALPVVDNFSTGPIGQGESVDFRGHIKIRYNTVDIELGKWCHCDCCVSFRPHVGIRVADIQERFRDFARGNGVVFDGTFAIGEFRHRHKFKGAGVRVGIDSNLCLCDGWSFFGRGAISAIWGRTHLRNVFRTSTTTVVNEFTDHIREDFRQVRFISDLSLGIRFRSMACGCYPMTIGFAWEHHYLFAQHRYWVDDAFGNVNLATTSFRSQGDVAFQGFTLSAEFNF